MIRWMEQQAHTYGTRTRLHRQARLGAIFFLACYSRKAASVTNRVNGQ